MASTMKKLVSFIGFHAGVLKELYRLKPFKTALLVFFSFLLPFANLINLKLSEYLTNQIAYLDFSNEDAFVKILLVIVFFGFSLILFNIVRWVLNNINNRFTKEVITAKKEDFMKKISRISYENFESSDFYDTIWNANEAPLHFAIAILHITALIDVVVSVVIYSVLLCRINAMFVGYIIIAFILYLVINKNVINKWDEYYDKYIIPEQRKSSYFENIISNRVNHFTIQVNRQYKFFVDKYETHTEKERKYQLKLNFLTFSVELSISALFLIVIFLVLSYIAKGIAEGRYAIGMFTLVSAVMFQLFSIFRELTQYIYSDKMHVKRINAFKSIMSMPDKSNMEVKEAQSKIVIKNLSYKYKQSQFNALDNVSCEFGYNQKVAIVGKNGSGKTTLMQIILGLLDDYSGECINTIGKVAAIMQDFQFYQMTIRENIELGRQGEAMSESEILDILKKVDLYDLVMGLPDGINTRIGQLEGGIELSKGQFQRLAVARMLADKEAKVWILDEPTAYLDPIAEIEMYQYILSLSGERLVLFISHRLGFAKQADRIIVMDEGRIAEVGTHDELMIIENGIYKTMFEAQREWYT